MLFHILEKTLGECPIRILSYGDRNAEVSFMMDYGAPVQYYPEHTLFYCDYDTLHKTPGRARPGDCLLIYMNTKNPDPLTWSGFTNVISTDDKDIYNNMLLMVKSSLDLESKLIASNKAVLKLIMGNKPIQEVINKISETYDHYADILDNAFNILASSNVFPKPEVKAMDENEYMAIKPGVIKYLKSEGSLEKMRSTRFPVYVEDVPRNTFVYSAPIFLGDFLSVGFLTVFVDKDEILPPVMLQHLYDTAQLLSLLMQKSNVSMTNKTTYFTHLLSNMIQGIPNTSSSYRERFAVFNYDLRTYKRICVAPIQNNLPINADIDVLASAIQTVLPNSVYVLFDNYIVLLSSENRISDLESNDALNDFLKHSLLKLGVSGVFEDENNIKDYYESAKLALRMGMRNDPSKTIFCYEDYIIPDIIDMVAQHRNLHLLCFKPVIDLLKYEISTEDKDHSLINTLFSYLNNSMSVQKTCEELFIHRNTLYYRLQKIKDIMQCDFAEYPNAVAIGITMQILRYLKVYDVFEKNDM